MIEREDQSALDGRASEFGALEDLIDRIRSEGGGWDVHEGRAGQQQGPTPAWRILPGGASEPDLSLSGQAPPPGVWAGIETMLRAEGLIHGEE